MNLSIRVVLFIVASLKLVVPEVGARQATLNDVSVHIQSIKRNYDIRKDGTYRLTYEEIAIIASDKARTDEGIRRLVYNPQGSSLKVLEAYTKNGSTKIPIVRQEDKPIPADSEGFDELRAITIAFADVQIGSELYLKYEHDYQIVPIPGVFTEELNLGGLALETWKATFSSEIPLVYELNDPGAHFKTDIQRSEGKEVHQFELKKPILYLGVDEEFQLWNKTAEPYLHLSSAPRWADYAKPAIPEHERILSAPLPSLFEKIRKRASSEKTSVGLLNRITSQLASEVRYLQDWSEVNSGHYPRELEVIARTRFGDCKDFSAATVAILRKLGHEAHMAWISRQVEPYPYEPKIPIDSFFDHAIVWTKIDGRVFWIDPTNTQSFAQGTFEDILDRAALILDQNSPRLERTPRAEFSDQSNVISQNIRFEKGGMISSRGEIRLRGRAAMILTGLDIDDSQESIRYQLIRGISGELPPQWKIKLPNLSSRIVQDLIVPFEYKKEVELTRTTLGDGIQIPRPSFVDDFLLPTKDRYYDFFREHPGLWIRDQTLEGVVFQGSRDLSCRVESPWIRAERWIEIVDSKTRIQESLEVLASVISAGELKSEKFTTFQKELKKCFTPVILVLASTKG